jgi:hypothetical protein
MWNQWGGLKWAVWRDTSEGRLDAKIKNTREKFGLHGPGPTWSGQFRLEQEVHEYAGVMIEDPRCSECFLKKSSKWLGQFRLEQEVHEYKKSSKWLLAGGPRTSSATTCRTRGVNSTTPISGFGKQHPQHEGQITDVVLRVQNKAGLERKEIHTLGYPKGMDLPGITCANRAAERKRNMYKPVKCSNA